MSDIAINDWNKLGSTIRAERRSAGLSQEQLAERAGISRSWVARLESGHRAAELQQILKVLGALELTMILRSPHAESEAAPTTFGRLTPWPARDDDSPLMEWHRDLKVERSKAWGDD